MSRFYLRAAEKGETLIGPLTQHGFGPAAVLDRGVFSVAAFPGTIEIANPSDAIAMKT